jgi:hypothetical protein
MGRRPEPARTATTNRRVRTSREGRKPQLPPHTPAGHPQKQRLRPEKKNPRPKLEETSLAEIVRGAPAVAHNVQVNGREVRPQAGRSQPAQTDARCKSPERDASEEKAKRRSETPHGTHCAEQAARRGGRRQSASHAPPGGAVASQPQRHLSSSKPEERERAQRITARARAGGSEFWAPAWRPRRLEEKRRPPVAKQRRRCLMGSLVVPPRRR